MRTRSRPRAPKTYPPLPVPTRIDSLDLYNLEREITELAYHLTRSDVLRLSHDAPKTTWHGAGVLIAYALARQTTSPLRQNIDWSTGRIALVIPRLQVHVSFHDRIYTDQLSPELLSFAETWDAR